MGSPAMTNTHNHNGNAAVFFVLINIDVKNILIYNYGVLQ